MASEHGIAMVFAVLEAVGYSKPLALGLADEWHREASEIDDAELMARAAAFMRRDRSVPARWPRPRQVLGRSPTATEYAAARGLLDAASAWGES